MDWPSQALASSIPFKSAYYFNFIQLLLVVCLIVNDLRSYKVSTKEALYAHSQCNEDIVIGNFLGKFLTLTLLNWITFAISIFFNLVLYFNSFELSYYFFYWITLTFPALVCFLGFSGFVIRYVRNQGICMILLLLFLGGLTFGGACFAHGLLDPCARYIPNMFSDFMGHVNLENYLLQRGYVLLFGTGCLLLSVISYPRIPNHTFVGKKWLGIACLFFVLAGLLAFTYLNHYVAIDHNRELYRQVYRENSKRPTARVVRNELQVKILEDGKLAMESLMEIENKNSEVIPLIVYLNPGLKISTIEINGKAVSFQRERQAVIPNKELIPGERCHVSIGYAGTVETDICFLEQENGKYDSPDVNRVGIYHFGYTPAYCGKKYTLLTPECIWYPVCVPPYSPFRYRGVNFTRYALTVEHASNLTAISQGNVEYKKEGKTLFTFTHDMPGISLCVGEYKKREITVFSKIPDDTTHLELYYLPCHEYLLKPYDMLETLLIKRLVEAKSTFEMHECVVLPQSLTEEEKDVVYAMNDGTLDVAALMREVLAKRGFDPTRHYPYRRLTLLETPCDFHCFPNLSQLTGEREQAGIVFIPEKLHSIEKYHYKDSRSEENKKLQSKLEIDINLILGQGSCSIRPTFLGKTLFIHSEEYPIMHDVLLDMVHRDHYSGVKTDDLQAVLYLKNHSLKDALYDNSLSQEEVRNIVRKKSVELYMYMMLNMKREVFHKFYMDSIAKDYFTEIPLEEYYRKFRQSFGFSLDTLVADWYYTKGVPQFDIRDAHAFQLEQADRFAATDIFCRFKVFNRSDIPGLIMTSDMQGWVIPPREGREIKVRNRKDVLCMTNIYSLEMPLARNLPAEVIMRLENPGGMPVDTTTGFFELDSVIFFQNNNEIVVDNEDSGFRVVKAKGFNLVALFRDEKNDKKYQTRSSEPETWVPVIDKDFYGTPVQSAFYKRAGSGRQKVEWNVVLPQAGEYEVFFYHSQPRNVIVDPKQEFHYTVYDGRAEHEVVASVGGNEVGWISLGIYRFSGDAKVTLCDKDRKDKFETKYGCLPQEIVADAIKWVKR